MKGKKLRYTTVKQDEVLDISLALSQAVSLLDEVAKKAIVNNDSDKMLEVADRWIDIAKLFTSDEQPGEHMNTDEESQQYGFVYEKEKEVNVEDDE